MGETDGPDLSKWERMQALIELQDKVQGAMAADKEPPYELRRLNNLVKEELEQAAKVWHAELARHTRHKKGRSA